MESERPALIGQLAADVARERSNPLQGIVTCSHLLRERGANGDGAAGWIERTVTQAGRATKIIRGPLDVARPQTPHMRPEAVNALLEQYIGLVENQAQLQNIAVEQRFGADLPPVVLDPSLMQQVIINLNLNAAEAMPQGGRLALATRCDAAARMGGGGRPPRKPPHRRPQSPGDGEHIRDHPACPRRGRSRHRPGRRARGSTREGRPPMSERTAR